MTREELKEHCEKQIKHCELWATYKGEEPHGKIYEEHKLILELLEQEAVSKTSILDKIRAEIEQLPTSTCTETCRKSIDADDFMENVIEIFDKYKTKSER